MVGEFWEGLQNFNVCVKVVLLANTGVDEKSPPERMLIPIAFFHITIFLCVYNFAISQILSFFARKN